MNKRADTKKTERSRMVRDLVLLISIPFTLFVIAAAAIYGPRLFAHPQTDFLYVQCVNYRCTNEYIVTAEGVLTTSKEQALRNALKDIDSDGGSTADSLEYESDGRMAFQDIYYYDASKDTSKKISLADAKKLVLDASISSPEGYTLEKRSNSGGLLFYSGDMSEQWQLSKGMLQKPVSLARQGNYTDIELIGWIQ